MQLRGGHTITIVGQGPVGLSATQLAAGMGARVIALDVSEQRLARAKDFAQGNALYGQQLTAAEMRKRADALK